MNTYCAKCNDYVATNDWDGGPCCAECGYRITCGRCDGNVWGSEAQHAQFCPSPLAAR